MNSWKDPVTRPVRGALVIVKRFNQDQCFSIASSLSFTTILALVPLLTVILAVLSLFPVADNWLIIIEAFLIENFVPAAGETVQNYLHQFTSSAGKLTALGLVFVLLSSIFLLATVEDAFNKIWRVEKKRAWLQRILIYWAILSLGPLLLTSSLSMSSALLSLSLFTDQSIVANATKSVLRYLPVLFELCAYMLFYHAIPNTRVRIRDSFYGAITATILFEITKFGFTIYILKFNSYQLIYGTLSTIPIFFLWIYICWLVLLIGALISAILYENATPKQSH